MVLKYIKFDELADARQDLLLKAKEIIPYSYNIYSNYSVASAVLTESGKVYRACNFENSSYGLSICAEPGALQAAFSDGNCVINCVAVIGGYIDKPDGEPPMPCGRCRQLISEAAHISGKDIEIIISNLDFSLIAQTSVFELLPEPFNLNNFYNAEKIEIYKHKCRIHD